MTPKPLHLTKPLLFYCHEKNGDIHENWDGHVKRVLNHGSHYEIRIESRSDFTFMIGRYTSGVFISIPAYNIGCDLANYGDYFWNNEHLSRLMNPVDAATVAEALRTLSDKQFI